MIRNTSRRVGRTAALVAAIALLSLGVAGPASAGEPEEHCFIQVEESVDLLIVCADTVEEADAAFAVATDSVRVEDPADAGESGARVLYTLATLYTDVSYGGSSYTFTRTTACNGVTLSSVPNLVTLGLNDAVSSFLTYASCEVRLYADINYGGSTYGYTTTQSSLPTFNDVASAARAR